MPEKRVLLGFRHNVIADLTAGGGWTIFDNTIAWLHPAPGGGGGNNNNGGGGGAAGGVAHVIVGNGGSPVAGDQAVIDRLENDLGYTVNVVDDGAPENVTGADLVMITQSVGTTQVTGKYVDEAVPVLTMSAPTWDEHNLVASQSASYPYTTSDTLHIEQAGHAVVAGATAPTLTTGRPIGYAFDSDVPADAEIIAAAKASTTDRASLIVFETGDNDATNTPVPDKRVLLGFRHNVIADLTVGGGWTIFDNTIAWLHPALGGGGGGVAGPQTISYTYTEADEPDTISYPDGTVVDVDYNALGQPNQLIADQASIVDQVAYSVRGQLTAVTVGNGNNQLTRAWAHENWSGRLLNQTSHLPGGANVQNLSYSYDTGGNVTLTRDQTAGIDQWACFTYDNADRLTSGYTRADGNCAGHQPAAGPDPYNVAFSYNQIGNITNATGTGTVNGNYTYGTGNAGPHAATAAGANSYAYDQAGNMTTRTTGLGTQTLTYDVRNRIQTITGAGSDMTALYDADGTRVKRTLDNMESFYLGPNYELTDNGSGPEVSIHHRLAGHHVATTIAGELMVITDSQLGTITGTVNAAGVLTAQRYTPHGANLSAGTNLLPVDFTFTGQTDDPGTGLMDYNARHYDPQLGRFIQADTVLDGLNRYSYVHNNPLKYIDPTGNIGCPIALGKLGGWLCKTSNEVDYVVETVKSIENPYNAGATDASSFADPVDYITYEMKNNSICAVWILCDIDFALRVRPGGPQDHKPEIIENFGPESNVVIGGEIWTIHHDVWSNLHYGYVVGDAPWRLDQPYLDCPAYQGLCSEQMFGAYFDEPFGQDNPLDYSYMSAGAQLRRDLGKDFTRDEFDTWLLPWLRAWSRSSDETAPERVQYFW